MTHGGDDDVVVPLPHHLHPVQPGFLWIQPYVVYGGQMGQPQWTLFLLFRLGKMDTPGRQIPLQREKKTFKKLVQIKFTPQRKPG